MKTYRISYTAVCPACNASERVNLRGMGESHADWITAHGKSGTLPDYTCKQCKTTGTATLIGVSTEQDGKK